MTSPNPKILTVDDEDSVRETIVAYLEDHDFEVLQADNGRQALETCRREKPDLVLLDLRLPKIDGIDVLATLTEESPNLPVIIVSGLGTIKDAIKSLKLGAWDYLMKPIHDLDILGHAVNQALERARLRLRDLEYNEQLAQEVQARTIELEKRNLELEKAYQHLEMEITERQKAEKAIHRERAYLQTLIDGVIDPAQVIDLDRNVLMMNQAMRDSLPAALKDQANLFCYQISHQYNKPCPALGLSCPLDEVRRTGETVTVTHAHQQENGEEHTYELKASPLWNEDGSLRGFLEITRPVIANQNMEAKLREHQTRLYHMSHHDTLTNLPNRLLFQDRLQRVMVKAQRHDNQVAVLFLDLDRFKKINESLGHEIGDKLLVEVSKRLQSCVRRSDTVARLSGDEFAIILDDIKDSKYVTVVTRKLMNALPKPVLFDDYELYTTASMGVSLFPADSSDVDGLMKCADTALFRAKEHGGSRYEFFTTDMNTRAFEFLLLESGLRKALEHEELVVYYQPQFDMNTNKLIGMEALLRWQHPQRGMVSPGDFIPLAEETGLIEPIGEWVLRTACAQNKAWQNAGHPPIRLAVNISARQFRNSDIATMIENILTETGMTPEYLELELTESIVMHNVESTVNTMRRLTAMGVQLSIDDFGTGYSSLSYLKLFPLDNLKIDRSFVMNINTNPDDAMIAASIIALAHNMNLMVIAEGVEDEKQLDLLRKQGCDNVQGFLFGHPVPPAEFVEFFKQRPEKFQP